MNTDNHNWQWDWSKFQQIQPCNEPDFWAIINQLRNEFIAEDRHSQHNRDRLESTLITRLKELDPYSIVAFFLRLDAEIAKINFFDMYAIYIVIEGWESLDGFYEFRNWVITLGEPAFLDIAMDPDRLADYAYTPGERLCSYDLRIGKNVLREKTGDIPDFPIRDRATAMRGLKYEITENVFQKKFPRVWRKFWPHK